MASKFFRCISISMHKYRFLNGCGEHKRNFSKVSCLKPELEVGFNNQITTEFHASFSYLAMAAFFGRQNVCLMGCSTFFMSQALEERDHAHKLIDYLNLRGNVVTLQGVVPPEKQCWDSPLAAFTDALQLESEVSKQIFDLHKLTVDLDDQCSSDFLENEFLNNQVEEYDKMSRHIAMLKRIGPEGLGVFIFDEYLLKKSKKSS